MKYKLKKVVKYIYLRVKKGYSFLLEKKGYSSLLKVVKSFLLYSVEVEATN